MNSRELILRGVQGFLGVEVLWHVGEFALAIYDEAWLTSIALGIHAMVVAIGVYFIGHDHTHHVDGAEGLVPLITNSKRMDGENE